MSDLMGAERLRALLEHSLDAIAVIEPEGVVSYVSPAVVRVLGWSPEEFIRLKAFEAVHPDDRMRRPDSSTRSPGGREARKPW